VSSLCSLLILKSSFCPRAVAWESRGKTTTGEGCNSSSWDGVMVPGAPSLCLAITSTCDCGEMEMSQEYLECFSHLDVGIVSKLAENYPACLGRTRAQISMCFSLVSGKQTSKQTNKQTKNNRKCTTILTSLKKKVKTR